MKILVVSATLKEIEPSLKYFKISMQNNKKNLFTTFSNNEIIFFITGIGCYSVIYELTKLLAAHKFDILINVGIAGSYNKNLKIGSVVNVISEQIGDVGIDDNGIFKTIFEQKFINKNKFPFKEGKLINTNTFDFTSDLKSVKSLSLNTVSGSTNAIKKLKNKFDADIESMEGAAFFYVCISENQCFVELRAISNYVELRCKENWDIKKAIINLNHYLIKIIVSS